MMSKKLQSLVRSAIAAAPVIPYIMRSRRRQRMMASAWMVSGLGLAALGGLVAVMFLSPRTRHRALDAAKGTYGRMNERIDRMRPGRRHHDEQRMEETPISNGL